MSPERYRRNMIHTNATNDFALISCSWCGSYVDDPDAHTNACPKIKPPPPPPVWESARTIQDRSWLASIMLRHVPTRCGALRIECGCKPATPPMSDLDWSDHLAEMVYRALEGRDEQ